MLVKLENGRVIYTDGTGFAFVLAEADLRNLNGSSAVSLEDSPLPAELDSTGGERNDPRKPRAVN